MVLKYVACSPQVSGPQNWHKFSGKCEKNPTPVGSFACHLDIPRTPMTSIFEGQPPQNKAFSNQNKGHLGSR